MIKLYMKTCLGILIWISYEYLILNSNIALPSLLRFIFTSLGYTDDPSPGKPISYILGWVGFTLMCTTNLYILKKRTNLLGKKSNPKGWLEFHILCGILGPILIIFHSNFKVNGLVAISFWSMIISFLSGFIGRFFYIQVNTDINTLKKKISRYDELFQRYVSKHAKLIKFERFDYIRKQVVATAIGRSNFESSHQQTDSLLDAIKETLKNKSQIRPKIISLKSQIGPVLAAGLYDYAIIKRKIHFSGHFQRLLGYWHSFHLPFAFFMYFVAIIHIAVALIFGVAS